MTILDSLTQPMHPARSRIELDAHALCGLGGALGASGSTARDELHRALARFDKRISWLLAAANGEVSVDQLPTDVALDWIVEPVRIFREHAKGRGWSDATIRENARTARRQLVPGTTAGIGHKYEALAVKLFRAEVLDDRGTVNTVQTRISTERAIHHATAAFLLNVEGNPQFTLGDDPTRFSYNVQQTRFNAAVNRFTHHRLGDAMNAAWAATRTEHWGTDDYGEYYQHTPEESEIIRAQALVRLMETGAALTGSTNEVALRTYFAALALSMRHAAQDEAQLARAEALFSLGSMDGLMEAYAALRDAMDAQQQADDTEPDAEHGSDPNPAAPSGPVLGTVQAAGLPWYAWLALGGAAFTVLRR